MPNAAPATRRGHRTRLGRYVERARAFRGMGWREVVPVVALAVALVVVYARSAPWVLVRVIPRVAGVGGGMLARLHGPICDRVVTAEGRVVDVRSGEEVCRLAPPEASATVRLVSASVSPDGRFVAGVRYPAEDESGDARHEEDAPWRRTVCLWDAGTGGHLRTITHPPGNGYRTPGAGTFFSPGGDRLLTFWTDTRCWETGTGKESFSIGGFEEPGTFSPDGSLLAVGAKGGGIALLDARTGEKVEGLPGRGSGASPVAFSPDGARILAEAGRAVQVWDRASKKPVMLLPGDRALVFASYSGDGSVIVACHTRSEHVDFFRRSFHLVATEGRTRIWDAESGELLTDIKGCRFGRLSPDGARIAGTLEVGTLETAAVWDAGTGEELCRLPLGYGEVVTAFLDDDDLLTYGIKHWRDALHLWRRRRPEWWWGHLCRIEVWMAAALGLLCLWQTLRRLSGSRAGAGQPENRREAGAGGT
jgi:WD40 repeat protein